MLEYLATRGLVPRRRARRDRGSQRPACRRSSFHWYRPLVEVLEDRTVLSFISAASYTAGSTAASVAVGDFNGDGFPDLVAANPGTGPNYSDASVSVLLGRGDGTFQPAQTYAAGSSPSSVAVGDFNGDGHLDLAVANRGYPATVSVLLGNGDGTFQAAQSYAVGTRAYSVAVGDFNGDGHLDLAVANFGSDTVSILLGKGDGTFQDAHNYAAGSGPLSVAVGDFNGDGHLDLAVANYDSHTVSILLGMSDGTFGAAQSYAVGINPVSVAVGDFTGDGHLDLAVANVYDDTVSILLGKGDGTFKAAQSYAAGSGPDFLAVADFNGDSFPDLVVANGEGTVSVLLGKGDGTFQAADNYAAGVGPSSVAVADFNGDSLPDLAVANGGFIGVAQYIPASVSLLLGNGDGTFQAARNYAAGYFGLSVALGDFNGDGIPDLAVGNFGTRADGQGTVSILLGKRDGTFEAAHNYPAGSFPHTGPVSLAVGDFDGDGHLDLAVANYGYDFFSRIPGNVSVLLGNSDGTFQAAHSYAAGSYPYSLAVGDFNGDGHLDLAVANRDDTVSVLLGKGDGTFQAAQTYAAASGAQSVAVGDFSGDGHLDLAVANRDGTVSVLLGKGDGTFGAAQSYAVGIDSWSVMVGDFNGDGHLDLVVAGNSGMNPDYKGTVTILLGNGDGTFQPAQSYAAGSGAQSVTVGDFNGDGKLDLVVANLYDGTVSILLGNGDGTFQAAQSYAAGSYPNSVAVGDFNGDGYPDLAVAAGGGVSVLLNAADWHGGPGPAPPRRPASHPTAHRQPQMGPVSALVAASNHETVRAFPLTSTDLQPSPVRQWPVQTKTGQPALPEATLTPTSRLAARHAQDTVFERWNDAMVDELAWNLLR